MVLSGRMNIEKLTVQLGMSGWSPLRQVQKGLQSCGKATLQEFREPICGCFQLHDLVRSALFNSRSNSQLLHGFLVAAATVVDVSQLLCSRCYEDLSPIFVDELMGIQSGAVAR
jgi:hypothetical protein